MAVSSLAIQAPIPSLALGKDRIGAARFNVSSTSDKPLQGKFETKPLEGAKGSWLHLEGEAQRLFSAPGPQVVTVQIKVPQDVPPGSYKFRLDGHAVDHPDDDFTEGPTVVFTIAEAGTEIKWWLIVLIGVLVLIAIGVGIWAVIPKKVAVPNDLVGKSFDAASLELKDAGLAARADPADAAASGTVTEVSPTGVVKKGSSVTLTLAAPQQPKVTVPVDLKGKNVDAATQLLQDLGLVVARKDVPNPAQRRDTVTDVSPTGQVAKGSSVTLTVATALPYPQIGGQWDSTINFRYVITQDGRTFTWRVAAPLDETATGTIDDNGTLIAEWKNPKGSGRGQAHVITRDDNNVAEVIKWDNGVVMYRSSLSQFRLNEIVKSMQSSKFKSIVLPKSGG